MESIKTETQTLISRNGNKLTIKEVVTTTTIRRNTPPEVKVVETVKEYDVDTMPEDLRKELGDIADPDTCPLRKSAPRKSIQGPSQQKPASDKNLQAPTPIYANDLEKLNEDCVKCHNEYRKKHGVEPVTYSRELARYAQSWAEELAKHEKFEHRKQDKYGENIYLYYSSNPEVLAEASAACSSWYSEISSYDFNKEQRNTSAGHFTQMIWKETREVGMGRARAPSGKQIIVANYYPPGNFIGSFVANVPRPLE